MASANSILASKACTICKLRKKGCDKHLPVCGYCNKRCLRCFYDDSTDHRSLDVRQWDVHLHKARRRRADTQQARLEVTDFSKAASMTASWNPRLQDAGGGLNVSPFDSLDVQIQHALDTLDRPVTVIRDNFFQGIHRWLPIIAPWRLSDANLIDLQSEVFERDTALLLLIMSLDTQKSTNPEAKRSPQPVQTDHLTVKVLFTKAQAALSPTIALIQAGILIALHEFASRMPRMAFVTMQTCRGMYELLDHSSSRVTEGPGGRLNDSKSALELIEKCNLARGLFIMDRLILLEAFDQTQQQPAHFPPSLSPLPHHFGQQLPVDTQTLDPASFEPSVRSALQSYLTYGFIRQAQAVIILDQVMRQISCVGPINDKVRSLWELDNQLQSFLADAMENYRLPGHHCGAIAVSIRTLFLLHYNLLALHRTASVSGTTGEQDRAISLAAIDSAARMAANVSESHMKDVTKIDVLPLTASYNTCITIQHLQSQDRAKGGLSSTDLAALAALHTFDEAFRRRWPGAAALDGSSAKSTACPT